jgi:hypothetical protein
VRWCWLWRLCWSKLAKSVMNEEGEWDVLLTVIAVQGP